MIGDETGHEHAFNNADTTEAGEGDGEAYGQ
jgi:hypothetical protein